MKRILCLMLVFMILLTGCSNTTTADFYYQRAVYEYDIPNAVIVSEERDITDHSNHLAFLIALYLIGPQNPDHISPFPEYTKLLAVEKTENVLNIELSDNLHTLSDSKFVLACTCLTLTFLEIAGVDALCVTSGERSLTLTQDMITLYDTGIPVESTIGG